MDIDLLKEKLFSEESLETTRLWCLKINKQLERESEYVDKIRKRICNLSNPEFLRLVVRLCEWESNYEKRLYERGFIGNSNLFKHFFECISDKGNARPCNEPFLEEKYIYKGITFKLYVGQGSFYRISMGKHLIFQST